MPDFVWIGKYLLLPPSVGTRQYLLFIRTFFDHTFVYFKLDYCLFYLSLAAMSVVGNKSDLEDSRQVPRDGGEVFAHTLGAMFTETSASDNIGTQVMIHIYIHMYMYIYMYCIAGGINHC